MRKAGIEKPYEKLKDLTRGHDGITKGILADFISNLELEDEDKQRLLEMTPSSYVGNAEDVVELL